MAPAMGERHKQSNVIGDLHGCRTVKFDSCNNSRSSVHTIFVIILHSVSLKIRLKCCFVLDLASAMHAYQLACRLRTIRMPMSAVLRAVRPESEDINVHKV